MKPVQSRGRSVVTNKVCATLAIMAVTMFVSGRPAAGQQTKNWRTEYCVSDWEPAVYTRGGLSEMEARPGILDSSATCTIAGRTGHAAASYNDWGNRVVYVWVCDEDGSNCGVEADAPICFGQGRSRDFSQGSKQIDGELGFQTFGSHGPEVAEVPVTDDNVELDVLYDVRVVCEHHIPL